MLHTIMSLRQTDLTSLPNYVNKKSRTLILKKKEVNTMNGPRVLHKYGKEEDRLIFRPLFTNELIAYWWQAFANGGGIELGIFLLIVGGFMYLLFNQLMNFAAAFYLDVSPAAANIPKMIIKIGGLTTIAGIAAFLYRPKFRL